MAPARPPSVAVADVGARPSRSWWYRPTRLASGSRPAQTPGTPSVPHSARRGVWPRRRRQGGSALKNVDSLTPQQAPRGAHDGCCRGSREERARLPWSPSRPAHQRQERQSPRSSTALAQHPSIRQVAGRAGSQW